MELQPTKSTWKHTYFHKNIPAFVYSTCAQGKCCFLNYSWIFFCFFPMQIMVHDSVDQKIWLNLENFFYADCGRKYYHLCRKLKCIPDAHFRDICSCTFIIVLKDSKDCWFVFGLPSFAIIHVLPFMLKYLCEE